MSKIIVNTPNAPAPIGPYSQAVLAGNTLYTSGQICLDTKGNLVNKDIQTETKQVMENLGAILQAAGMDYSHVVKTTIFINNMGQFTEINDVYAKYFVSDYPARETVQVSTLPKFVNIEISMIAVR